MSWQTIAVVLLGKDFTWMMAGKYKDTVYAPRNVDELQDVCEEYAYAGFPVAVAVVMECMCRGMDSNPMRARSLSAKRSNRRSCSV